MDLNATEHPVAFAQDSDGEHKEIREIASSGDDTESTDGESNTSVDSDASYDTHVKVKKKIDKKNGHVAALEEFLPDRESSVVRGFCILLHEYLADACGVNRGDGKNTGGPDRTILYGLQRPPMNGQDTILRCDAYTSFDELAPTLLPFYVTNALPCVRVSCDPKNKDLL